MEEAGPAPVRRRGRRSSTGNQQRENPEGASAEASTLSGFSLRSRLAAAPMPGPRTSPKSWSGSGDRPSPFGSGAPPEGAGSNPAYETVAGFFGRHQITSVTLAIYDICSTPCKLRTSQDFAFQSKVSRSLFSIAAPNDQTPGMQVRPEQYGDRNSIRVIRHKAFRYLEDSAVEPPEVDSSTGYASQVHGSLRCRW